MKEITIDSSQSTIAEYNRDSCPCFPGVSSLVHIKQIDSRGEDGDFDGKVKVIEEVDGLLPRVMELKPDVLVVTGDHSTPAKWKAHSWHPLPVILNSRFCRVDGVKRFDEISCIQGGLSRQPTVNLMAIVLANAGRLAKFGA